MCADQHRHVRDRPRHRGVHTALKNGFLFIDWDRSEAARRTLGCLYGLTSDGNNTYPKVPSAVTVASIMQNLLSAVLIFLLLLGIRNLLKLK